MVSRRLTEQSGADKFVMKIPNNKVGLVIGKGGETIKNMQANTRARIQLIPLHLPLVIHQLKGHYKLMGPARKLRLLNIWSMKSVCWLMPVCRSGLDYRLLASYVRN